jgi:UDP-N-acetylenolpyruvoylglucosamine reductase
MAIEYVGCTEGRGISPTTEIGGGIGGTLKVVANASLKVAYKKTKQENTPVALQVVKDCMEIAKSNSSAADPEQTIATNYQQQVEQSLQEFRQKQVNETPTLMLSSGSARKGEQITVSGSNFWPNETVDIRVQASLVDQVKADAQGAFSTTITIPSSAPPPDFDTTITASGETSAKTAEHPFHTAP